MPRYRLTISYDGTEFFGWQKQYLPAGAVEPGAAQDAQGHELFHDAGVPVAEQPRAQLRTVALCVERAVFEVLREPVKVLGASRTDSGVHARAQTAAFTTSEDRRGPADERLAMALNSRLPEDIVVRDCQRVDEAFDPITDCVGKGYRYSIHTGIERALWDRRFVAHVREPLDDGAMRAAAEVLVGRHDFAAFASAGHGRESTVRTIFGCEVCRSEADPRRIDIDVSGDGFLYNMVRIVAGTLCEAGKGRRTPDDVRAALRSGDRRMAGATMPPEGLCLMWMRYPVPIGEVR
ncbi:MAG: tRNA pseudouridine synthase A [Phycisphaerales bacterium]